MIALNGKTVMCIDSESLRHPNHIGLDDEDIASQPWLETFCNAEDARNAIGKLGSPEQVWVVSSDDMEGINLAAALKRDNANNDVKLISFSGTGSEISRCQAAGIELVKGKAEFCKRYLQRKGEKNAVQLSASHDGKAELDFQDFESLQIEEPPCFTQNASENRNTKAANPAMRKRQNQPHRQMPKSLSVQENKAGHIISVVSGNGGVGKSTVASCLAVLLQERGLKTVLLDLDLQFGDAGFLLGIDKALSIDEVIAQPERIVHLHPEKGLPVVIGAPHDLERSEIVVKHISEILNLLSSSFDAVVVNTGSFWSELHIQVIEASEQVLFILDQRPSSVRSCSRALDLCMRCGIPIQPFRFMLNLCSRHALLTPLDVSCALHGVHVGELKDGGREVGELLGAGLPLELMESKNPFIESMRELVDSLANARVGLETLKGEPVHSEKKPLFSGLRKRRTS